MLPAQRARIGSVVGELRCHVPLVAKKKELTRPRVWGRPR